MSVMAERKGDADELLRIEECDAWLEYLERTKGQPLVRYEELEPWAWARLAQRLKTIRARRKVRRRSA